MGEFLKEDDKVRKRERDDTKVQERVSDLPDCFPGSEMQKNKNSAKVRDRRHRLRTL